MSWARALVSVLDRVLSILVTAGRKKLKPVSVAEAPKGLGAITWQVAMHSPDSDPATAIHDQVVVEVRSDGEVLAGVILDPAQARNMASVLLTGATAAERMHEERQRLGR